MGWGVLHQVFPQKRNSDTLQGTKQRSGKDLMESINRFRGIALDCYDHCEEKTLVEMCMGNMIMEYRAILENLEIS